jgi:hypothetical protein
MRFRDYFLGQRVLLRSPLKPADVVCRINGAAKSSWWPFNLGVIGGIRFGRVRLRYASSPFEYNAKPLLLGRIDEAIPGSVLRLTYRGPRWSLLFDLFWYGLLATIAVVFLTTGLDPPATGSDTFFVVLGFVGMAALPAIMHLVGTRRSDEELVELISFLADTVDAKPIVGFADR